MDNCIFCQIIQGQIPSAKVYEDEQVLAFLDITQVTKGHTLLIPKKHATNLLEMDGSEAGQLFERLPLVANKIMAATGANGMNVINNTNEVAGQTVFHTHIHLLPRYDEQDELKIEFAVHEPDFAALGQLAEQIAKQ